MFGLGMMQNHEFQNYGEHISIDRAFFHMLDFFHERRTRLGHEGRPWLECEWRPWMGSKRNPIYIGVKESNMKEDPDQYSIRMQ